MKYNKFQDTELIDAIASNPNGTMMDIAEMLGSSGSTISYRVKKLLDSNKLSNDDLEIVSNFFDARSGNIHRKPKASMKDFTDAYEEVIAGELSKKDACEILGISYSTFTSYEKKLEENTKGKEKEDNSFSVCEKAIAEESVTPVTPEEESKPAKNSGYTVLFSAAEKISNSDKYITLRKSYNGPFNFDKRTAELEKMIFSNHSDEVIRVTYHKDDDLQDLLAVVHVCSGANVPLHITFNGGMYDGKELSMDEESETRELMRLFPNTNSLESYDFESIEDIRQCRYFYSVITESYDKDGKFLKRDREIMASKEKAEQLFIQYATQILSNHDKICIKMYESNADGQTVSDNETSLRIMSNFRV